MGQLAASGTGTLKLSGSASNTLWIGGPEQGDWSGVTLEIASNAPTEILYEGLTLGNITTGLSSVTVSFGFKSQYGFSSTAMNVKNFSLNNASLTRSINATDATLNYSGTGTVTVNYDTISNINATPASTWFAANSTDGGNNTGWTFSGTTVTAYKGSLTRTALYKGSRADSVIIKGLRKPWP